MPREADDTGGMFGNPDLPQREGVQLRAAWAEALGTALSAFEGSSVTRLERDDLDAVVVVAFGDATVVAGPPRVKDALASLSVAALRDAAAIAAVLPGARAIGTGHLLFTGTRPGHPPLPVDEASSMDVASVGASLPQSAWAEAGRASTMEHRWAVRDGDLAVAVAGYQRWHGTVAHVGRRRPRQGSADEDSRSRRHPLPCAPRSMRDSSRSGAPRSATMHRCGSPSSWASRGWARRRRWRCRGSSAQRSAGAEAERVPGRVEEDAERLARLVLVLRRAEREDGGLALVEVVDHDVEVHLLRMLLAGPDGRAVVARPAGSTSICP